MSSMVDNYFVGFGLIYYLLLVIVYIFRAYDKSEYELKLRLVFSAQLIPFLTLSIMNLLNGEYKRLVSGVPIIIYLVYDLWYRVVTEKKPVHHPDQMPIGLKLYIVLLMLGSIGLNWYGYIVSETYGRMLVAAYFVMMGSFGFYQYKHNQRKNQSKSS